MFLKPFFGLLHLELPFHHREQIFEENGESKVSYLVELDIDMLAKTQLTHY